MQTIWQKEYELNTVFLNSQGRLGFYSLLQILQDTAVGHAQDLQLGKAEMTAKNLFWVLTRQKVIVKHWPTRGERLKAKTWLRVHESGIVLRDFQILGPNGEDWGSSTSAWLALSSETRKPVMIDAYKMLAGIAHTESTGLETKKIISKGPFERLATFQVRNSDIDGNYHVNNTRYAQWVLDAVPFDHHKTSVVTGYEVNFLAETHLGETIHIERGPIQDWTDFRGVREIDQKVVFICRIKVQDL